MSMPAEAILGLRAMNACRAGVSSMALALVMANFCLDVATGPAMLPIGDVVRVLLGQSSDPMLMAIVFNLRLPIR